MTILRLEDWKLYPNAVIDRDTSNQSFIRLSALYRDMGVQNHSFILAIYNTDLIGVDPFDPNLTTEQMIAVVVECRTNFWYFLREVARAPARSSPKGIPIRANRGNIAFYWLFWNHITTIWIQIRQTGKSLGMDVLYTYLLNIRCRNANINILTKDETLRSANLERLKEIELELPFYMKMRRKGEVGNTEEIKISALGNSLHAHLPNKSPKMALNVGRGLTGEIFGIDEGAFLSNIGISLSAALAGGTTARDLAREAGEPYGTAITTTAGKKDDRDGRFMFNFMNAAAPWTEIFFDCKTQEELETTIRKNSRSEKKEGVLRVNCTFNHRQLGLTDAWLKRAIEEAEVEGDDADRDFFNVWTSGSQSSPLSTEITAKIRSSEVQPACTKISPQLYITRWYIPECDIATFMANTHCIMGLDTSNAAGGDDIFMVVRDIKTGAVVAAGNFNETNLITFSEFLLSWFVDFENLTMVPEHRSSATGIMDYLSLKMMALGIDPFKRIFNRVVQEHEDNPERYADIIKPLYARPRNLYETHKKLFGFATSGTGMASRNELYSNILQSLAKYTGTVVHDKMVIDQILALVIKNGRVDHAEGEHDDGVIGWLLSGWLLFQGKNLSHYGINSRDILVANQQKQIDHTPDKVYFREEQNMIRRDIESTIEQVRGERDEFIIKKLEHKLMSLSTRLVLEDNEVFSIDTLIHDIREQRKVSRAATTTQYNQQPYYNYGNQGYYHPRR